MLIYRYILIGAIILLNPEGEKRMLFSPPLNIPISLSANFGELRPGHFHSGIDFKTNGVTGKRVFSVADGYVYRISVSPGGFGRALYIRHANGYSTVYAHLDSFEQSIEDYVTDYQYGKESFEVNIFPEEGKFRFMQGDLIGFSGNSGSSQGPHLHFEVRRSGNENPIDPVAFFNVSDNIRPTLNLLTLYEGGITGKPGNESAKREFQLTGSGGNYRLKHSEPVEVSSSFGLGISTWDFVDNSWNKCGVRSIELTVDSTRVYMHQIDEFSFAESRYINAHIDYREYVEKRRYIQKTFTEPNNGLSIYKGVTDIGIISLNDNNIHTISLRVTDFAGNHSNLSFKVRRSGTNIPASTASEQEGRMMPFASRNEFNRHDIELSFPKDAFYDTLWLRYSKVPGREGMLADIHTIHDRAVPVHKGYTISIRPQVNDSLLLQKAAIISVDGDRSSFIGGKYSNGFISATVRDFGSFSIGCDTLPTEITPLNFSPGANMKGRSELRFRVKDDFSSMYAYEGFVDGKWTLIEYDPKNDLLLLPFAKARFESGKQHSLRLVVKDGLENISEYTASFTW